MELSLPFPVVLGHLIEVLMYLLTYYFHIVFIEIRGSYVLNGKCECLLDSKVKKTNGKKFKNGTHRNPLHSYTLIMRKQKEKLRKQFHSPLQRK